MARNKQKQKSLRPKDGSHLLGLGYLDYIGARFLLNNDFVEQGITLSSTAIEKYIKAVLTTEGVLSSFHLNNFDLLKKLLEENSISLLDDLDKTYIKLLGDVYKFRYYDRLKHGDCYGFQKWQVIGQLDYTVALIEARLKMHRSGQKLNTAYSRAIESKDEHLLLNNFILNGTDKKAFMEKDGPFYGLSLDENLCVINMEYKSVKIDNYDGTILVIEKWDSSQNGQKAKYNIKFSLPFKNTYKEK